MYKVFFNDRAIYLTDDFSKTFQERYGLFFKYKDEGDLEEIIDIYSKLTTIKSLFLFHYDIDHLREDFRKCFYSIDAAGGVVRNSKNEFLFIYRRDKWDLPKGKVDKDENYQQAALREVMEETGLKNLQIKKPLLSTYHTYPYKKGLALKKTYWFEMEHSGREIAVPETEEDITEVRWFKAEDLHIPLADTYALIKDIFVYLGVKEADVS